MNSLSITNILVSQIEYILIFMYQFMASLINQIIEYPSQIARQMSNKITTILPKSPYQKLISLCFDNPDASKNVLFQIHSGNQAHIIFNRPKRMNAFTMDMIHNVTDYIIAANSMDEIKYIIVKGNGGNFTSGNDLGNPTFSEIGSPSQVSEARIQLVYRFGLSFMESQKPIFALIEGKCIGLTTAMLPLFDRVFSTEDAYFTGPFVQLGLVPEIASSYTFPAIFGQNLSEEILTKGKQVTAKTLQKFNVVKSFVNIEKATQALQQHISELNQLQWNSYIQARRLMRMVLSEQSIKAFKAELQILKRKWANPEMFAIIVRKYLTQEKAMRGKPRPKL